MTRDTVTASAGSGIAGGKPRRWPLWLRALLITCAAVSILVIAGPRLWEWLCWVRCIRAVRNKDRTIVRYYPGDSEIRYATRYGECYDWITNNQERLRERIISRILDKQEEKGLRLDLIHMLGTDSSGARLDRQTLIWELGPLLDLACSEDEPLVIRLEASRQAKRIVSNHAEYLVPHLDSDTTTGKHRIDQLVKLRTQVAQLGGDEWLGSSPARDHLGYIEKLLRLGGFRGRLPQ
jgi:hypothetical protein